LNDLHMTGWHSLVLAFSFDTPVLERFTNTNLFPCCTFTLSMSATNLLFTVRFFLPTCRVADAGFVQGMTM
jgi:hypothetical protein